MSVANDSFAHLHVHTEYSMLDGASLLDGLFSRVANLGMTSIAMTDHGNLHGAYDFWKKANKYGVKPIIGIEAYLTPGTPRQERRRVKWVVAGLPRRVATTSPVAAPTPT
ncbi:PHP domain-containing protein [Nocardioides daphniae]|uniref:PHP domain-containing protein n=1 Tax=Nocardioides daphniae TaxID=402297 RepID=UPI0023B04192|nr:PHP domain-containing protein [Nocardioides daphniae]